MNRSDTIQMMARCKDEIQMLRNERAVLAPKAEAYDLIKKIIDLIPQHSQGFSEDMVYKLDRAILEEAKEEEAERQAMIAALVATEEAAEKEPSEVNSDGPQ